MTISTAMTYVVNLVMNVLAYAFNFNDNPVIATIAVLPIISVGIALASKLIHHKHKV